MDINKCVFRQVFNFVLALRGERFRGLVSEYLSSQYHDPGTIQDFQLLRLNKILEFASSNVSHYKNRIPKSINNLKDVKNLPLLEKWEIQESPEKFMCRSGRGQRLKTSGGSTGAPVTLLKDSAGMAKELAAAWRGYGWAGVRVGDRQARFWGVPKSRQERLRANIIDFVCNRKRFTAFGYSEDGFKRVVENLNSFSPNYFYGYTSIIRDFSKYVVDEGISGFVDLTSIITTAEVLSELDRDIISSAFGVKVFDEYGCGEVGTIAHECENGNLHINSENLIVEIIDKNGNPVPDGTSGEVVVTDLTNFSMPLIRYRLKDYATLSSEACSCGRTLPVICKVHGREYDILINSVGKKFHGEFFLYIIEDARKDGMQVNSIQFIQDGNLDIFVKVVSAPEIFVPLSRYIEKRVHRDFDSKVKVRCELVHEIEREPSGKFRVVKGSFNLSRSD
ncbi:MAG: hypothetical protein ABJM19_10735 [Marinobacter sp.]|uniref:phenylacetate--CoA ligase family protein n=1 Tax=Marinobacter sp. TaxID=50741 RepID=UPI00329A542B